MELSDLRRRIEIWSLPFDVVIAACLAIPMGALIAYSFILIIFIGSEPGFVVGVLAVVGSAAFLAMSLTHGAKNKPRARSRVIGAEAGLLTFVWILFTPGAHQRVWFARDYMPGLSLFDVIALGCITFGLIVCDRAWTWTRKV